MTRPRTALTRIALVATLLTALTALAPSVAAPRPSPRARMYQVTNGSRLNNGVHKVDIHYTMSKLAHRHSVAMANRGYIFHTSNPSSVYLRGVRWSTWGENVGVTGGTIGGIEQAFMQSPDHRANILNRDSTEWRSAPTATSTAISGSRSSSTADRAPETRNRRPFRAPASPPG